MLIKISGCVVHIFATFTTVLTTSTHELIPSCTSSSCTSCTIATRLDSRLAFFTDDSHPVEIILCKIEMLSSLVFHWSSLQVDRHLFDFKIIFLLSQTSLMDLGALCLISRLAMIVV